MTRPYDVTAKELVERAPADWVAFLGRPTDPDRVRVIDADVSVVAAEADKVVRVDDPTPWLMHVEFQTSHESGLPRRLLRYNAPLHHRHGLPVTTTVVLMRPEANPSDVTGEWAVGPPVGPAWAFRYGVVRLWQVPAERLLAGGLGVLPLAFIAATTAAELPAVRDKVAERFEPLDRSVQDVMWAATLLLMGLRYEDAFAEQLLARVFDMKESTTYQAMLRRSAAMAHDAMCRSMMHNGTRRFGPPPAGAAERLYAVADFTVLESINNRLFDATGWDDWLAEAP